MLSKSTPICFATIGGSAASASGFVGDERLRFLFKIRLASVCMHRRKGCTPHVYNLVASNHVHNPPTYAQSFLMCISLRVMHKVCGHKVIHNQGAALPPVHNSALCITLSTGPTSS